jgi:hypothetical protein
MIAKHGFAAAVTFLGLALHGSPACADGGSGESVVFALSGSFWMTGAAVGLATDAGIGAHLLSSDGSVPRSWAVTGTAVWGVATVAASVLVFETHVVASEPQYTHDGSDAAGFAVAYGVLGLSAASLAVSIYAITRPPRTQLRSGAARRSSLSLGVPVVVPTPAGATLAFSGMF